MPATAAASSDRFEPARAKSGRLYALLHEAILTGRIRPGEALSENLLAEQYGISRTPVREVFQRLINDGLLRVVPQIGSFVAPINLAAVADSQFIREALECQAVRHAADAVTEPQLGALHAQVAAQRQRFEAGDQRGFFALDEAMHQAILEIAGHATVWQVIASVKAQLDRVRHLSLEDADWLAMIFRQHQDIVDRIAAHDGPGAAAAMQHHLRTVFAAVERIAAAHAAFFESPTAPPPPRQESP
ncbi:MAG: GntR family transcriptional regulator [Proteobacteria bacterium]|nr:GntR family transcriptional regulator [Pseudomonadota bacterium]